MYYLKPKRRYLLRIVVPSYPRFNIYSFVADKTTSLGAVCVATSANKLERWDVEIIDENNFHRAGLRKSNRIVKHELIQKQRPADVVGFYGGLTSTVPHLYELAKFYKKKGVITIAGGQHFVDETIPEALSSGIDYVVRGEGEVTIKELLKTLVNKGDLNSVAGVVYKHKDRLVSTTQRPNIQNLDALPTPNFSLLRYVNMKLYPVGRVRGCVMNCEFCTVKGKPRFASRKRLFQQIKELFERYGAREFFIVDDLFGQDRKETIDLCKMLADYQRDINLTLSFTVQIRLDKAKDKELLSAMREANINVVTIGFESPIDRELKAMSKSLNSKEICELTKVFHKFGFFIHGMFIFGYPMKDSYGFAMPINERIRHFKHFIKRSQIDTIQILLPIPLPGTELRSRLLRENRIYPLQILGWEYYDGTFPLFKPDYPMTSEEMHFAARRIMGSFYHLRYMFLFLLNLYFVCFVPFYVNNIKKAWRQWFRKTRNYIFRIIGQRTIRNWTNQLYKEHFFKKLNEAKHSLNYPHLYNPHL